MTVYRIANKTAYESPVLPADTDCAELFFICRAGEVPGLLDVFGWDEDAIEECANLDETVRYTSYDGYEFISLLNVEPDSGSGSQREINLFVAPKYLALVLPDNAGVRLERLAGVIRKAVLSAAVKPSPLMFLYYMIFDNLVADFSETLELLEDDIEALAELIVSKPCKEHITEIGKLRKTAYTYKKQLRALSNIGGQILMDENDLLNDDHKRYFNNISARLMQQYDFAESLYGLSNDLLHTYDSKFSAQMNATINKLTVITLIFAPLTFIAGVYGMNFIHMPELAWPFGYPAVMGLMAAISAMIFVIMKKNKWL
jgi:magnesium transporter